MWLPVREPWVNYLVFPAFVPEGEGTRGLIAKHLQRPRVSTALLHRVVGVAVA